VLHFDLNVSILLREHPFLERFDHAARLGFGAVEFWWPAETDLAALVRRVRDAGLRVALFNFYGGSIAAGERGLLNHPQRAAEFRANVPLALDLAQRLGCPTLNALAGKWLPDESRERQLERVRENLRWAAEQAYAAGVTVVVESLNSWDNGPCIFTNTRDTLDFLATVGAPNLKYQYDIYHMQRMEGNIVATLGAHIERIGHIQVADSPTRHEPGSGELNYRYIFEAIAASGYRGMVGLEYNPRGAAADSFGWLPADRRGPLAAADLLL
jgi:hydroxypyruvate isomerase